jgi:hypothetical protein
VDAIPSRGRGGFVNSPNSFHIAGGIQSIVANQINVRVEAGGPIGVIAAIDDGPDRPASLTGRFTASSFGRVSTDENGTANFELTVTDEAWQLDGKPAYEEIRVPAGSETWFDDQIHLSPGARAGTIVLIGAVADADGDGVSDTVEDSAPGNGDGNQDGVPDSQQPFVASLISADGSGYVTIVASQLSPLAGVTATNPDTFGSPTPSNHLFHSGYFEFEIDARTVDGPIDVQWILHAGYDVTALYAYGQTSPVDPPQHYSFRRSQDPDVGVQSLGPGDLVGRYLDGQSGDRDLTADGFIQVIAAPAIVDGIPAQNPIERTDVNNDRRTSALDALRVINVLVLARIFDEAAPAFPANSETFLDVNGDQNVTALDALRVINAISRVAIVSLAAEAVPRPLLAISEPQADSRGEQHHSLDEQHASADGTLGTSRDTHTTRQPATAVEYPESLPHLPAGTGEDLERYRDAVDDLLSSQSMLEELLA